MKDERKAGMDEIKEKLANVKTMPELDALRIETIKAMNAGGSSEIFYKIQKHFIKAKNRLKRIPVAQRNW